MTASINLSATVAAALAFLESPLGEDAGASGWERALLSMLMIGVALLLAGSLLASTADAVGLSKKRLVGASILVAGAAVAGPALVFDGICTSNNAGDGIFGVELSSESCEMFGRAFGLGCAVLALLAGLANLPSFVRQWWHCGAATPAEPRETHNTRTIFPLTDPQQRAVIELFYAHYDANKTQEEVTAIVNKRAESVGMEWFHGLCLKLETKYRKDPRDFLVEQVVGAMNVKNVHVQALIYDAKKQHANRPGGDWFQILCFDMQREYTHGLHPANWASSNAGRIRQGNLSFFSRPWYGLRPY